MELYWRSSLARLANHWPIELLQCFELRFSHSGVTPSQNYSIRSAFTENSRWFDISKIQVNTLKLFISYSWQSNHFSFQLKTQRFSQPLQHMENVISLNASLLWYSFKDYIHRDACCVLLRNGIHSSLNRLVQLYLNRQSSARDEGSSSSSNVEIGLNKSTPKFSWVYSI